MSILDSIKEYIKQTPLAVPYIWIKNARGGVWSSQSNEAAILERLVTKFDVPRTFVEFGFSGWEFNCIALAGREDWSGLLLDGNGYNAAISRQLFGRRISVETLWLDLTSLDVIFDYAKGREIGILSVDVDGNDYWFLERLITIRPAIVVAEFNVAFGHRPISVPYDSRFDRTKKHGSREYYGASIEAMNILCTRHGYRFVDMSSNGINAFFVRGDLLRDYSGARDVGDVTLIKLHPDGSTVDAVKAWEAIKHLPYVDVSQPGATSESPGESMF